MQYSAPEAIPSLDLADFTSGDEEKKQKFIQDLGDAFTTIGFVAIKNHGLSETLSQELYSKAASFFALPDSVKQQYEIPGLAGQRGYVSKGREHAKGRNTGDLKEFYHIGQQIEDNDPIQQSYPKNVWPEEVPGFREPALAVYKTLEQAGKNLLRAIAVYLGLPQQYFDEKVHNGNSILRPIHYFPITEPDNLPADAVRAAEHGDINLITLLMGASAEGLEVKRLDGTWIPITALPGQLVVNVGDMLARHTNNVLKSTLHRVVNPPRERMSSSRYSIPFFMHARSDMDLTVLPCCVTDDNPARFPPITAGEFLNERLAELGLKSKGLS